jgi:hypothetical protein
MARLVLLVAAILGTCACSTLPLDTPEHVVRQALEAVVAHDLDDAAALTCGQRRNPGELPFPIPGLFEASSGLPGFDVRRRLGVTSLDAAGVVIEGVSSDADSAIVHVSGTLVERFDPAAVENLFRTYEVEGEVPHDQAVLDRVLARTRDPAHVTIDEDVRVLYEVRTWRVCPQPEVPA